METIRVHIDDLSDKAEGIGHIDGKAVFVKGALPGEDVEAVILKDKGRYYKALVKAMTKAGHAEELRFSGWNTTGSLNGRKST